MQPPTVDYQANLSLVSDLYYRGTFYSHKLAPNFDFLGDSAPVLKILKVIPL